MRLKTARLVVMLALVVLTAPLAAEAQPVGQVHRGDPGGEGFVTSLAHPGGNMTGLSDLASDSRWQAAGVPQGDGASPRAPRRVHASGHSTP